MKSLNTKKLQKDLLHDMLTKKECFRFEMPYKESRFIIGSQYGLYLIDSIDKFIDFKHFSRTNYICRTDMPFYIEDNSVMNCITDYKYLCDRNNMQVVKYYDRTCVMFTNSNSRLLVNYEFVKYFDSEKCNFYFKDKTSPLLVVDLETEKLIGYILPINYSDDSIVHVKPINDIKF